MNVVQELNGGTPTANLLTGLGIDETLLRTDSAGPRAFLTDGLGSTLALTDSAGLVQSQYTYEPFGKTTATGVASTNAFKYTGREDDGTGLYSYRARYYHPALQRFISEDSIGFGGGDVNLYGYVFNDPVNLIDPSGHNAMAGAQAGGAAGAVVCGPPCAVIGAGVGLITGAIVSQCIWDYLFNKTPNEGEPNSTYVNPGSGQERKYGSDGKPEWDIDWHPDHGTGVPHGHNWGRGPNGEPIRGPGVPVSPWPKGRGKGQ